MTKSRFFQTYDPKASEDFQRDFRLLRDLTESAIAPAVDLAVAVHMARSEYEARELLTRKASELNIPYGELRPAVYIAHFVLDRILADELVERDDPADLANDSVELGLAEADQRPVLQQLFAQVAGAGRRVRVADRQRSAARATFPTAVGVSHSIAFRPVFRRGFKDHEEVNSYQPECIGFVPVAALLISLDVGDPLTFQLDIDMVNRIADRLTAVKKELTVAKAQLGLEEKSDAR